MAALPPLYNVMVKRTHKFAVTVQTDDPAKIQDLAKDAVKTGKAQQDGNDTASVPIEYDVNYVVKSEVYDPDAIP